MTSGLPSLRMARRYLFLWVSLALIPIWLAGYLTKKIVYVDRSGFDYDKMSVEEIGIFIFPRESIANKRTTVNYVYEEGSKESFVEFLADVSSAKVILNHVPGPDACVDMMSPAVNATPVPLKLFPIHLFKKPFDDTYFIDWEALHTTTWGRTNSPLHSEAHAMWIKCKLKSFVKHSTYTERYIYFHGISSPLVFQSPQGSPLGYLSNPKPFGLFGEPVKWTLDLTQVNSAKNIKFGGGTESKGGAWEYITTISNDVNVPSTRSKFWISGNEGWERRDVGYDDLVEARWESLISESHRDIIIVIIGALVALGAAMILESIRPFIERLVGGHEGPEHVTLGPGEALAAHSESASCPSRQTSPETAVVLPGSQPQSVPSADSPSQPPPSLPPRSPKSCH